MRRALVIGLGAAGVATAGALIWALGPGAPTVATWLLDGMDVWRLGKLHVYGLSGPHIGALRAERATIADEDGVWVEGRDLTFDWSPLALFSGRVDIQNIEAASIDIRRQPQLSADLPGGPAPFDVDIASMRAPSVHLAQAFVGREAQLRFDGSLDIDERELAALALDFARTDADTDLLSLHIGGQDALVTIAARGDAGGVIATAMGVPDSYVRVQANARGDADAGDAELAAEIGAASFAEARAHWDAQAWIANASFDAARAPLFNEIARRFGPRLTLDARGGRFTQASAPFQLFARGDNASLRAHGALTPAWRLDGDVVVSAHVPDLNRAAREIGLGADDAAFDGTLAFAGDDLNIRGQARIGALSVANLSVDAQGPVRLTFGPRAHAATLDLKLAARADAPSRRLFANGQLSARLRYLRREERMEIESALLESDAVRISVAGRVDDESGALEGEWRMLHLGAASPELSGAAQGRWRMTQNADQAWRFETRGAAMRFASRQTALTQLVGATPRLDLDADIDASGFRIRHGVFAGAKLRVGATGLVADALDLRVEATARGPLRLGAAEIGGAADITGRIVGPLARPRIQAEAQMSQLDVAGAQIAQPTATFTYDSADGRGVLAMQGIVNGAAAQAHADLNVTGDAVRFTNARAEAAGFAAHGQAAIGAGGPMLDLSFSGPLAALVPDAGGVVQGRATVTPAGQKPPLVDLRADIRNAAIADIRLAQAQLALMGPADRIEARADFSGRAGESPIDMTLSGVLGARPEGGTILTLDARGDLGGEPLATRAPAEIVFADGRVDARATLIAGEGGAEITWRSQAGDFAASAVFEDAELAPFAALAGARAEGAMSGDIRVQSVGDGLSGAAHLTVDGARLPARMRAPLDVRIDADLAPDRVTGALSARSADGLDARIQGSAPVTTRADPLRVALAPNGAGRIEWRASGPADSLWPLVAGLDQSLGGRIQGAGELTFTADALAGAGQLSLADGRFEDKRAGLTFVDVDAQLTFDESGASRFTLSARDEQGGLLSGEGAARGAQDGRIALNMQHLRFIDREDMRATASGDLALTWTAQGAELSGAIALDDAEVTLATQADAIIPEIDVIEINRPGGDAAPLRRAPGPRARLDLALTAPGRIYTRGRGLNAEWSLDAHLRGTTAVPLLQGEARLIRGEFDLAGRPFELTRGRIQLMGALEETRVDLLAERVAEDLTARIAIAGRLFDPDITLSSDPALPEDEILPNILFGRGAEDLSPLEGAQLAASLAALAGGSAFDIAGMARAAIGLDRLDVREDAEGVLIAGGRYLTRDVYFEVSRSGLGQAGAKLEWRARPQLSLVTSFLANGDQRVSVRWRRDY